MMLARDGEVFVVTLRVSSLILPEERPGKKSAPPFVTLCVSSLELFRIYFNNRSNDA